MCAAAPAEQLHTVAHNKIYKNNFYRPHRLVKQGDNELGSVHPSVCPSAKSNNHHLYQSTVIVCNQWAFTDNHTDLVHQLHTFFFLQNPAVFFFHII